MTKRAVSLKALLSILYALALLSVAFMLLNEFRFEHQPFSLSSASVMSGPGHAALAVRGENFHSGLKGVLVKNLINEKALLWKGLADATARAIDVQGSLALVSCYGNKLVSIAIREGEMPELLGSLDLPDDIHQIRIVGNRALVAMRRHTGMALVDLQDPTAMKLVRRYPVPGLVTSLAVEGETAYYLDLYRGVGRFDLSGAPLNPEAIVALESPWCMALQGSKLVVGSQNEDIILFNLSADGLPVEVGRFSMPLNIRGVALTEDALAVALIDGTTYFYRLTSWPKLGQGVTIKLPGRPFRLERVPGRQAIAASLVAGGVVLIDVRRPAAPEISGELKVPTTFLGMKMQSGALWAATQAGLQVFALDEIEQGEDSRQAPQALISGEYHELYSWGGHVYGYRNQSLVDFGSSGPAGMRFTGGLLAVADVNKVVLFERDNGQARRAGVLPIGDGVEDTLFADGILYVITRSGLQIFSGHIPEELRMVSSLPLPGVCRQLAKLDSGHLLVSTIESGILVVDVQQPQKPVQIASLTFAPHLVPVNLPQDILVAGDVAFIALWAGGVYVVDLSNPSDPQLVQMIDTPGFAAHLALYDDLLLVADKLEGMYMIDVRDRKHALQVGSWPLPLRAEQVAVSGDGLITSNYPGGTMKLPLPQRLQNLDVVSQNQLKADLAQSETGQYVYIYAEGGAENVRVGGP